MNLPSYIKPSTKDAYNYSYATLYCSRPKDIRDMIDKTKNTDFSTRETEEFFKEVRRIAEYEASMEELKALERKEKSEGKHPSQQGKVVKNATPDVIEKPEIQKLIPPNDESNPS